MKRRGNSRSHWTSARGLTLLEMLVTLVILSFVAVILGQALNQLARVERLLEGGQLRSAVVALRAEWVRAALTGLLPGTVQNERLLGTERELQGMSTEVPQWPAPGLARLHLRLSTDDRAGVTRLELLAEPGTATAPVVLLEWPGPEGRFVYLDAQQRWVDRWPGATISGANADASVSAGTDQRSAATLPLAVMLNTGPQGPGLVLAVPLAKASPAPTRAALEGM